MLTFFSAKENEQARALRVTYDSMTSPLPSSCRSKIQRSLSVVSLMCAPVVAATTVAACGSSELDPIESVSPAETSGDGGAGTTTGAGNLDSGTLGTDATRDATTPVTDSDAGHVTDGGGSGGASTCKRGIASTTTPPAALAPSGSNPGVTWWYDWSNEPADAGSAFEFVPMIWGSAGLSGPLPAGAKYLLGFNEPNFKAQSNLTPTQAAADWPQVEALAKAAGVPIVSPAVNYCGSPSDSSGCSDPALTDPYTWLTDFMAACPGCEVDAIAIHWYNCDLPSLQAYIEGNTSTGGGLAGFVQFGKPIWVTELACSASSSVADQETYMKAAVPYLEGSPYVQRYSWFSAGPIPNALLVDSNDAPTDLGKLYASLPQTSCD
jgi:hypothetical protein